MYFFFVVFVPITHPHNGACVNHSFNDLFFTVVPQLIFSNAEMDGKAAVILACLFVEMILFFNAQSTVVTLFRLLYTIGCNIIHCILSTYSVFGLTVILTTEKNYFPTQ